MAKGKGPRMIDPKLLIEMGFDSKTGLPLKFEVANEANLKTKIKRFLRIIDEQNAVNRYKWYNLPCNITSQELEKMLYYKGQLCFFYFKDLDEFYFMPYALDGTIDFYGRYNNVHPVPFSNGTEEDEKLHKQQQAILSAVRLKCVYGVHEGELTLKDLDESCVLLHDYTKQVSQIIIPRQQINEPIISVEAECIPYMRTSLIASSGVKLLRVNGQDESNAVLDAANAVYQSALNGTPFIPATGSMDFQDFTNNMTLKAQEYMLAMQSIDNLRLSSYGLDNGGLFEKKQHILESENAMNQATTGIVMDDGLAIRQNFCNIVNSIWNLGIWCEPSESAAGADLDGDGLGYDEDTGEHSAYDGGESDE